MAAIEIRSLYIEVSDPQTKQLTTEARRVRVVIQLSDGQAPKVISAFTSMNCWPTDDLLNTVKKIVSELKGE